MGCGSSSQVENVVPAPKAAAEPARPATAANGAAVTRATCGDENPVIATTMDELNVDYTIIRLLLLGAAESGKTTLLEQIRLLYKQNYSDAEFTHRKAFIYNNILISIRKLIERMQETGTAYENPDNARYAGKIMAEEDTQFSCFTMDVADAIQRVWRDGAVQKLYERRSEINLNDSSKYFLENLASINRLDFTPSPRDLIMSYVPTVGVQNVIFSVENRVFQLFDIGGQRIDRRKWATMYDGIDAILFCIAVSEYNQTMIEDPEANRLQDSLTLLEKISNEPKFKSTPLLLFLNEIDVFREKLPLMPLEDSLPEYKGNSADDGLDFIEGLAKKAMEGRDESLRRIYRTCAIDTEAMSKILENVFRTVLKVV
ncbi:hypothetical protein Y032_0014g2251 [Ancylostoma ceylanicum]|uniref:G-protein alpha subunit n=4 Tax=Ancylostoma TaxID=29169 RepID=A0A016V8J6_9BILA|nr:hypothetical protein Y032_0014g2251 [Ancylostoma ceylanicum]